jgi:hypothetical protein
MKIKATKRLNGLKMVTIVIEHHIGLSDVQAAIKSLLVLRVNNPELDKVAAKLTREMVWDEVRTLKATRGSDWEPEGDDYDDLDELVDVPSLALSLFPEFD